MEVTHPAIKMFSYSDKAGFNRINNELIHACGCRNRNCPVAFCPKIKQIIQHMHHCKKRTENSCDGCQHFLQFCNLHSQQCITPSECTVVFCAKFRSESEIALNVEKSKGTLIELSNLNLASTADQQNHVSANVIATYYIPSGYLIDSYCKKLDLKYDNNQYMKFLKNIQFFEIKSTSKPASYFPTNDTSGFSCFSLILCGSDDQKSVDLTKTTISKMFYRTNNGKIEAETMESIIFSSILKEEHIKFVVELLQLRIMLYFDGKWQQFGDFSSEATPLFLIEKKVTDEITSYEIILSLKE